MPNQQPLHIALPQTMTVENLAAWIETNNIEKKMHEERFDLTETEIAAYEHDSSVASRAIDKLQSQLEHFKGLLKDGITESASVLIEPTVGLKILQANREFADQQIELGYRTENTELYGIPYGETKKILFFDIEGQHFEQYDYKMNPFQVEKYSKPLFEGMKVTGGDGSKENPAVIEMSVKKSKSQKYVKPDIEVDYEDDGNPFI